MLRVKTGCITCRIRRVKCDEAKPECKRCRSTGRKCDGYAHGSVSRKDLIPLQQARRSKSTSSSPSESRRGLSVTPSSHSSVFQDDIERQHFDFFRSKTAPHSNAFVSSAFWSHIVFQTVHEEPTIRHCSLALSAWHRFFEEQDEFELHYAVEQYQQALGHANSLLQRAERSNYDMSLVLTALIIFHCIQNCFGDFPAAEYSLRTCRKLAEDFQLTTANQYMQDIILTIARLDIHAITISDASAPYQFPEVFCSDGPDHTVPPAFEDVEHCCRNLLVILKDAFHLYKLQYFDVFLEQDTIKSQTRLQLERENCLDSLKRWSDCATDLEDRQGKAETMTMALMRVYHTLGLLAMCKGTSQNELDWDVYMPQLVYMLDTISAILQAPPDKHPVNSPMPFSCELGIICPLFFIATNCREPLLRRKAVSLMAESRRREGRWESIGAALVAQRLIEIEEEGLGAVVTPADVPDCNRVGMIEPRVFYDQRRIDISYVLPAAPTPEEMVRNEVIYF